MENYLYFLISLISYFKVVQGQEYTGILASTTVSVVMLIILIIVFIIVATWNKWFPSYMRSSGRKNTARETSHTITSRKTMPITQHYVRNGLTGRRSSVPLFPKEIFVVPKAASEIHGAKKFQDYQPDNDGYDDRFPRTQRSSSFAFSNRQEVMPFSVENPNFLMNTKHETKKDAVYASIDRQEKHQSHENIPRGYETEDDLGGCFIQILYISLTISNVEESEDPLLRPECYLQMPLQTQSSVSNMHVSDNEFSSVDKVIMRVKVKERKNTRKCKKKNGPLRRSLRLKLLSVSMSSDRSAKVTKVKNKKFQRVSSTHKMRNRKQSIIAATKSKQTGKAAALEKTKQTQTPGKELKGKSKRKTSKKDRIDYRKVHTDPESFVPIQKEIRRLELHLFKTIRIEQNYYGNASVTRFSDVAFLDDNHILALDDNWLKQREGQRICCIRLDGTLVCDLLLPGYPWSVVVLSPTEAVVSIRRLESNGLFWISVDVQAKSLEITRRLPLESEPHGLSYIDKSGGFLVSYYNQPYMSLLNQKGEEIKKIPCSAGAIYRCLILDDDNILFLDNHKNIVSVMNQKGKVTMTIKHCAMHAPIALRTDCYGNIYVGNFGSGVILKFDRYGKYRATFQCGSNVCAIEIDRTSDRIIAAQDDSLLVYELDKNV